MAKYVSGFCGTGMHEGMRLTSPSGKNLKTCTMVGVCKCSHPQCHSMYDKMFEMSDMPRVIVDNSEYEPDRGEFKPMQVVIVEAPPVLARALDDVPDEMAALVLTSVAPGRIPPDKARAFGNTATGRAARGELEAKVKQAVDVWVIDDADDTVCSPQYLSDAIYSMHSDTPAPSTGAITAVLDRWVKLGFAETARKPVRFVRYTDEAIKVGLDEMKNRAKRAAKVPTATKRLFG